MRGTSQASLATVQDGFEPILAAAGTDASSLANELFSVVDLLDSSGPVRRALSDPSRDGDDKAALVGSLLTGRADARVVEAVQGLVRGRWSSEEDLVSAVEHVAVDAALASAENAGNLETVEEELFRIIQVLAGQRELRRSLVDLRATSAHRAHLARSVFSGSVAPVTALLLERVAAEPRGRSIVAGLTAVIRAAAARRSRLVATVTAAAPLTEAQQARLTTLLDEAYGRKVKVHVAVNPELIGGMRVQIGSDVVEATVLSRLDDVRRRLAG